MPASLRLEEKPACSSANPKPTPISRAMSKSSHSGIDISDDIGPITNNFNYSYFSKGLKAQWLNGSTGKKLYLFDTFAPLCLYEFVTLRL
jgi:hypothetical protein